MSWRRRPVSRVLSPAEAGGRPFLWGARRRTPRATYPDDRPGNGPAPRLAAVPSSLLGLAPGGVCRASAVAGRAVRSYRPVSPLPAGPPARRLERPGGRYAFCGTFPEVALAGRYPAPCSRGARTFLPRVAAGAAVRPPATASQLIAPRARSKATTSSSRRRVSSSATPSGRRCRNRRWKATRECRRDTPWSSSG
jgi:hypothetical protein